MNNFDIIKIIVHLPNMATQIDGNIFDLSYAKFFSNKNRIQFYFNIRALINSFFLGPVQKKSCKVTVERKRKSIGVETRVRHLPGGFES